MPLVIPATYAEITVVLSPPADLSPSTVSWGTSGVTTSSDLLDAVQASRDAWMATDSFGDVLSSEWVTIQFEGRTDPAGSNLQTLIVENTAGTGGASVLPSNCSALFKKTTGLGGRQKRGRMFIPGLIGEADVDAVGNIDPTVVTNLGTNATTFKAALVSGGFDMYLLHNDEVRNPAFPPPATDMMPNPDPTPDLVTDLQPEAKIATQRRRMR